MSTMTALEKLVQIASEALAESGAGSDTSTKSLDALLGEKTASLRIDRRGQR